MLLALKFTLSLLPTNERACGNHKLEKNMTHISKGVNFTILSNVSFTICFCGDAFVEEKTMQPAQLV